MANPNTPRGLVAVRRLDGIGVSGSARIYQIPAADTGTYYVGDAVVKTTGTADANGIPGVTLAALGGPITGVVVGFSPTVAMTTGGGNAGRVGAQAAEMFVHIDDDPESLFEIQENDSGGTPLPVTAVGKNANLILAAGNKITGASGSMLDSSTVATTATFALSIIEFPRRADNVPGAAFAKVYVRINNHTETNAQHAGI